MTRTLAPLARGLAAIVAFAPCAHAQTNDEESDASVARFEAGVEQLRAEDYEAAAASFRESYRLRPRVTTMCNLALTYDRWGSAHRAQAIRAYRACARDDTTGRFREHAERRAAEIERELVLGEEEQPASPPSAPPEEPGPRSETLGDASHTAPVGDASRPGRDRVLLGLGIGTAAFAASALTAAIVLALDASATVDDLRARLGDPPRVVRGSAEHDRLEGAQDAATASIALYVVAAVAAAGGAVLIAFDLAAETQDAPQVVVHPFGASLRGRF